MPGRSARWNYGAARIRTGYRALALVGRRAEPAGRRRQPGAGEDLPDELRRQLPAIVAASAEAVGRRGLEREAAAGGSARGEAGRPDAQPGPVHGQPHGEGPQPGSSTRCWAATSRSGRWWTSSRAGGRTTPSWWARRAWGRAAMVEGFALRIADGDVPAVAARTSPSARWTWRCCRPAPGSRASSRTGSRGLIEEVKSSPTPIILFIDEAHTLIGAGGAGGAGRRRQPAQARAGPRRAAHHRGHHLVRVQEVLREGPRAGAPLPGGEGGGARRGSVPAS